MANDATTATTEEGMGEIEVLSTGHGHLTLKVGRSKADQEKARRAIEDMLRRGYSIFVETEKGKPLTRVKRFNPKRLTYIIDAPVGEQEVSAEKAKATAVAKSAGG